MTGQERDGGRVRADGIDLVIDEAVADALGAGRVDLREKVLTRLEGVEQASAARRPSTFVLRPAIVPTLGALLLVVGVAILWERANQQLSIPSPRATGGHPSQAGAPVPGLRASAIPASPAATPDVRLPASDSGRARPSCTELPAGRSCETPVGTRRRASDQASLYAASLLEMDAMSATPGADEGEGLPDTSMPGAPAGELGDRIAPMPTIRPIVIHPITTPPIEVAPPVSTLGKPVSTLADETGRDPQVPAKLGGL